MTIRRFVQDPTTLEFREVGSDYVPDSRNGDRALWGDRHYDGMRTTDGADISTRSKHRAYMHRHGLTTVDDFKDYWHSREAQRNADAQSVVDPSRKHDIARAIARLEKGRR